MTLSNKIPVLLMFPIAAIAIYFLGGKVQDVPSEIVNGARKWMVIFLGVYIFNYVLAWFLRDSWPAAMARMLGCGLFGYIAISELVDLFGGYWGHWSQLFGGEGPLENQTVYAARYVATVWTVNVVMMVLCISVGFESQIDKKDM